MGTASHTWRPLGFQGLDSMRHLIPHARMLHSQYRPLVFALEVACVVVLAVLGATLLGGVEPSQSVEMGHLDLDL